MTVDPAPAPAPPATCDGCDWFKPVVTGWCSLHDHRVKQTDAACEYRRQLEDDSE